MRLLFVCNQGENRSLTAADLFRKKGHETKSAGVYSYPHPLTEELLDWADLVFVFEDNHIQEIKKRFPDLWFEKRLLNLEIPDIYNYGNQELVQLVIPRVNEWLREFK